MGTLRTTFVIIAGVALAASAVVIYFEGNLKYAIGSMLVAVANVLFLLH